MHHFHCDTVALLKRCVRAPIPGVLLSVASILMFQPAHADLVTRGAQWKFLDGGLVAQAGWQSSDFDDSSWSSGSGQFGYGDGDETTVLSYGENARRKPVTTYFRKRFNVSVLPSEPLTLRVQRDDGVIVYLNGAEVFRDNMPAGSVDADTLASAAATGEDEFELHRISIEAELLVSGSNTLAVEVHLAARSSPDLSFDLQLTDSPVVRGPYLQKATESGITVRWRTANARDAVLRYGTDPGNLRQIASNSTRSTEHVIALDGLEPDTRYYYGIGDSGGDYPASDIHYFDTHPVKGSSAPTRIWVLGDSGTANSDAAAVSSAYTQFNNGANTDVWLMLGDNAYDDGTDEEYQAALFDMYPQVLGNSVLWPTLGNHDAHTADSGAQSGNYYDIFTLPTDGESGGVASGTEAYYSFDYGNIHFVSLDSHDTNRSANGAMATWLKSDLAANTQEWLIAFWHHPPYSKGSHDSDTDARLSDMRANFLPILESHGVDLVLAGHSHSYERSMLIDGHYGTSGSFDNSHRINSGDGDPAGSGAYTKFAGSNNGSVYSVAGSSGKAQNAPLDHPVMVSNLVELGSMVIDIQGKQLDAIFLDDDATVRDSFRIVHETAQAPIPPAPTIPPAPSIPLAPSALSATVLPANEVQLSWTENATDEDNIVVQRSTDLVSWTDVAILDANATSFTDQGLNSDSFYYYSVVARNSAGESLPSNIVDVTTPEILIADSIVIGGEILDHDRVNGKRWTRVDFDPLITGTHTIRVTWSGNADIRVALFRIRPNTSNERIDVIDNDSPAQWSGALDSSQQYYLGVWSASGSASFTATLEVNDTDIQEPVEEPVQEPVEEPVEEPARRTCRRTCSRTCSRTYPCYH